MSSTYLGMSTDQDFSMEMVFCEWLTLIHSGKPTHMTQGSYDYLRTLLGKLR